MVTNSTRFTNILLVWNISFDFTHLIVHDQLLQVSLFVSTDYLIKVYWYIHCDGPQILNVPQIKWGKYYKAEMYYAHLAGISWIHEKLKKRMGS